MDLETHETENTRFNSLYKLAFADGAHAAESASQQNSFDIGFQEGLKFGMTIGYYDSMSYHCNSKKLETQPVLDTQVNCQTCLKGNTLNTFVNQVQQQKESNQIYIHNLQNQ